MTGDPFKKAFESREEGRVENQIKTYEQAYQRTLIELVPGESKKPSIVTHERFKELEAIKEKAASAWATAPV